ncbi:hypothetical protein KUCAC02_018618, partial [Chaenocephalus aceratus]
FSYKGMSISRPSGEIGNEALPTASPNLQTAFYSQSREHPANRRSPCRQPRLGIARSSNLCLCTDGPGPDYMSMSGLRDVWTIRESVVSFPDHSQCPEDLVMTSSISSLFFKGPLTHLSHNKPLSFALPPPCDGPRLESRHPFAMASLPPNLEGGGSESLSPMPGFSPFRELSSGLPDVTAAHLHPGLTADTGSSNWPDLMFSRIAHTRETMSSDGISSLSYSLVKKEKLDLYTRIHVDVGGAIAASAAIVNYILIPEDYIIPFLFVGS